MTGVSLNGVFLMMARSQEYTCCTETLPNGSVSYILNDTLPEDWISSWTKNGDVIASEDGEIDKHYVLSKTEKGYILKQNYPGVVCKLESPKNGVSREIKCIELCKPEPVIKAGGTNPLHTVLPIVLPIALLFLFFIAGYFIYKKCQRRSHRDIEATIRMHPINEQGQDQNMDWDQEALNHQ
ncbi:uncharacterized protein LOC124384987 isoform X2 [Silurus meridionalis]|uniref:uncharacterized protein LOC124384987 isoform X2 n=1 Tax=Silurus meridionalis TaxID=175797 RepID=UPI001EEAC440|nr:uncharacterized protein LOC124384987 isoform X2 [Silurus meridionalis]